MTTLLLFLDPISQKTCRDFLLKFLSRHIVSLLLPFPGGTREWLISAQYNWTRCNCTPCYLTHKIAHRSIGHVTFAHRSFGHISFAHRSIGHCGFWISYTILHNLKYTHISLVAQHIGNSLAKYWFYWEYLGQY